MVGYFITFLFGVALWIIVKSILIIVDVNRTDIERETNKKDK